LALPGAGKAGHEDEAASHHHDRERCTGMKLFSTERANALIPQIEPLVERLLQKRRDLAISILESGTPAALPSFGERKEEIERLVDRIEAFGCIVKDIDLGLVDFPALLGGEQVWLCWKAGEASVQHWHGIDEGFRLRKPLE
jgi:hypothetical protein